MAGQISAAEGAILKGAATVSSTRGDLEGRIKTVESQILAIGSNWVGPAATAFNQLMVQWNQDASKVTGALVEFEEKLRSAQRDYDTTDSEHQATFSSLSSRMGAV